MSSLHAGRASERMLSPRIGSSGRTPFCSLALLALLLAAGCNCGVEGVTKANVELEVQPADGLDLGKVRVGETKTVSLTLTSRGRVSLKLVAVEREGLSTDWWLGTPPTELAPNEPQTLAVTFAPEAVGPQSGTLVLKTDSTKVPEVRVAVRGEGVLTHVVISPDALDFGAVEVDTQETRSIVLHNEGIIAEDVQLVAAAAGSPHFTVGPVPGEADDTLHLEPGATIEVPVTFSPRLADPEGFASSVVFLPCPSCDDVTVPLTGTGVTALLSVTPADCLDFGEVNPGSRVTKSFSLANAGQRALHVLDATLAQTGDVFTLGTTAPLTVPGTGTSAIEVTYAPTGLTRDEATLTITTDTARSPRVPLCIKGSGGGPDLSLSPDRLAFGQVAVGTTLTRNVRVANVGVGTTPLVVSRAFLRSTSGSSFSVAAATLSLAAGRTGNVAVTFAPTAAGDAADTLVLETNDADSPVREIPLTGTSRVLPACQLDVVPSADVLAFGNVAAGRTAVLPIALRNTGPGDCIVHDLALEATTDRAFGLSGGPRAELSLTAGETLHLTVSFTPAEERAHTGALAFRVSDPAHPDRRIALTGTSVKGCLLIAPDEVDFGTAMPGCSSQERVVNVYNTCTAAVRIDTITLADQLGQPFRIVGSPTLPLTMNGSAAPALRLRYRPEAEGTHVGALLIGTSERPEPYHVGLAGRAAADALQHDRFNQERRTQVDVLFIVDNSGSMTEEQAALATNFAAFLNYANARNIDYRIAITTTDMTPTGARGRFVPVDGSRPRILTPSTPNVMAIFAENVNVGTNGSAVEHSIEPAYAALQPSMLVSVNDGFLRNDALLSIITVTDEKDSSPETVDFYYGWLLNIKGARRSEMLTFSAICVTDPNIGDNYGARVIELARRTGGVVSDIATDDWSRDLERLGASAFGFQTSFFLGSPPSDPEALTVTIDGIPLPPKDGFAENWFYDPETNAVTFDPLLVPEPGSTLEVVYPVSCEP